MSYLPTWTSTAGLTASTDASAALQYVNSASTTYSQWDVSIAFRLQHAVVNSAGESTGVASNEVVQVVMSPTHAKVLADLLARVVTDWEAKFGDLPDVEHLMSAAAPQEPVRAEPESEELEPTQEGPEESDA